jgi:hypothetical protein
MVSMSEPSKEELLARIAELEKQSGAKKSGKLEFRVTSSGSGCSMPRGTCGPSWKGTRAG